jgi:hypothetical protein
MTGEAVNLRRNDCVQAATDEMELDTAEIALRIPGMLALLDTRDADETGELARNAVVKYLDQYVAPKEQLRRRNTRVGLQ